MLGLTLDVPAGRALQVLCIGAHCDDIEIGCGGTILSLLQSYPHCRLHWLVLSSDANRGSEGKASARAFVRASARGEMQFCDLPDGLLPLHLREVKAQLEQLKASVRPDLVFTHHGADRHQDHRTANEATWQTFRDHPILEYEIPKYDGDLTTPNLYMPLTATVAARKVSLLMRHFPSQRQKSWFQQENFEAIMRLRGLECRSPSGFAEGFHCRKLSLGLGSNGARQRRIKQDRT